MRSPQITIPQSPKYCTHNLRQSRSGANGSTSRFTALRRLVGRRLCSRAVSCSSSGCRLCASTSSSAFCAATKLSTVCRVKSAQRGRLERIEHVHRFPRRLHVHRHLLRGNVQQLLLRVDESLRSLPRQFGQLGLRGMLAVAVPSARWLVSSATTSRNFFWLRTKFSMPSRASSARSMPANGSPDFVASIQASVCFGRQMSENAAACR